MIALATPVLGVARLLPRAERRTSSFARAAFLLLVLRVATLPVVAALLALTLSLGLHGLFVTVLAFLLPFAHVFVLDGVIVGYGALGALRGLRRSPSAPALGLAVGALGVLLLTLDVALLAVVANLGRAFSPPWH